MSAADFAKIKALEQRVAELERTVATFKEIEPALRQCIDSVHMQSNKTLSLKKAS